MQLSQIILEDAKNDCGCLSDTVYRKQILGLLPHFYTIDINQTQKQSAFFKKCPNHEHGIQWFLRKMAIQKGHLQKSTFMILP